MTYEECYENYNRMKSQGHTEKEIADVMGMSVNNLRHITRDVSHTIRVDKMIRALELKEQGYGSSAIGREMGINESSVRRLLDSSNRLECHRDIETERIYRLLEEGYDYSSIACKLGYDENHIKWIVCNEETITPTILQMAEELSRYNLETRPCTCSQILFDLQEYYSHDAYNITEELIDYILVKNGYGLKYNYNIKLRTYSKQ